MVKIRIILIVASVIVIWLLFLLPKVVVENESQLESTTDSVSTEMPATGHAPISKSLAKNIKALRNKYFQSSQEQKSSIFADSLADLYREAGQFDSAAWFAEKTATFINNKQGYLKAGNSYYEAYTFAMEPQKQAVLAEKAREYLGKVLELEPKNLEAKTKIAMTYLSSKSPMQGIKMLREVLAEDPENELALFDMGMLSIQSGQFSKAVEYLEKLIAVNPRHLQGQFLLGEAYMNNNARDKARVQFEKVKKMDNDPAVQATVDSYLKDLK